MVGLQLLKSRNHLSAMRPRRPTIPLADWRIASDLEGSRAIQRHSAMPATGCTCAGCQRWSQIAQHVLPTDLQGQLARLGIQPEYPADLYAMGRGDGSVEYRVIYQLVGRLLSGPAAWREDAALAAKVLTYQVLRPAPQYFAAVVLPHREVPGAVPMLGEEDVGELLQIELRIHVP